MAKESINARKLEFPEENIHFPSMDNFIKAVQFKNYSLVEFLLPIVNQHDLKHEIRPLFNDALASKDEKLLALFLENPNVIEGLHWYNPNKMLNLIANPDTAHLIGSIPPITLIKLLKEYAIKMFGPSMVSKEISLLEHINKVVFTYNLAIKLHPEKAENYYRKANLLYAMGKQDEALTNFSKAISLDSSYVKKVYLNLDAVSFLENHEENSATIAFMNVLTEFSPDNIATELAGENIIADSETN